MSYNAILGQLAEVNLYMFGVKVLMLIVGHILYYRSAKALVKSLNKAIADIGDLDPALLHLFEENGVRLNADGTVRDVNKYNRLVAG